ncbi:MAG: RNB domain-containing ribonuclease, partial [Bacteroidales bacterium]|nr:RNB domain-containing ribonuclease [Bacteroidales bacterium]
MKKTTNLENKIIELLSTHSQKLNYKQISSKIEIFDKEGREEVKKILQKFVAAKIVITFGRGNYKINQKFLNNETTGKNYVVGKLDVKYSGVAYLLQEGDQDDIFIAERNISNALHNDIVKVMLFPPRQDHKPEGQVVEIIERSKKQLVGTIQINKGIAYFVADSAANRHDVLIPGRLMKNAKNGDKVIVGIVDWTAGTRSPIGEVIQVLGKPGNNDVEMQSILAEFDFPLQFPENVVEDAARILPEIPETEIKKRKDCRQITTFTIDPADAKDFDDAISYERLPNGLHRVGVHIADVSFYVK